MKKDAVLRLENKMITFETGKEGGGVGIGGAVKGLHAENVDG